MSYSNILTGWHSIVHYKKLKILTCLIIDEQKKIDKYKQFYKKYTIIIYKCKHITL